MALDTTVLNRILAGAASLVEQAKASADRENALKTQVADLQGQLGQAQSAIAADDAADATANTQLTDTANALDTLLKGPETPVVETPAPTDAPAVISGTTDPVVVSQDPAPSDPNAPVADPSAPVDAPVSDPNAAPAVDPSAPPADGTVSTS